MAIQFTAAEVEAIARLAQLELSPAEVELFGRQLGEFLEYANDVLAVDTTGVEPTANVLSRDDGRSLGAISERDDQVRPCLDRDEALASAPDPSPDAGLFRVPRVIG